MITDFVNSKGFESTGEPRDEYSGAGMNRAELRGKTVEEWAASWMKDREAACSGSGADKVVEELLHVVQSAERLTITRSRC